MKSVILWWKSMKKNWKYRSHGKCENKQTNEERDRLRERERGKNSLWGERENETERDLENAGWRDSDLTQTKGDSYEGSKVKMLVQGNEPISYIIWKELNLIGIDILNAELCKSCLLASAFLLWCHNHLHHCNCDVTKWCAHQLPVTQSLPWFICVRWVSTQKLHSDFALIIDGSNSNFSLWLFNF